MIRLTLIFAALLAVAAAAAGIANLPGTVTLELSGYQVELRLAVLAGLLAVALVVLLTALSLAHLVIGLPARFAEKRRRNDQTQGEAAMAEALMALARGDAAAAAEATGTARRKLPQAALPRLMAAQAALLDNRPDDAEADYHAMLTEDTTLAQKILGLEGLYYMSRARGDIEVAGTQALQVLELAPKTEWALDGMMALAVQIGDWPAAHDWLRRWARSGQKRKTVKRRRAVLYLAEAQGLMGEGSETAAHEACDRAVQAASLDAGFVPAVALAARLQAQHGRTARAQRLLKQAWTKAPHAELAQAWLDCTAGQPQATRQRAAARFVGKHKDTPQAHVLRARLALQDKRWRLARTLVKSHAETEGADRDLCLIMADAETGLGDAAAAADWQERARRAPPPAGWTAGGLHMEAWQALCPVTGRLDAAIWQAQPSGPAVPVLAAQG